MKSIIQRFKNLKKQEIIKTRFHGPYAFVGIGTHVLSNLYPVLDFLHVPLRYIITRTEENAKLISETYPNITATTNLQTALDDKDIKGIFVCATPSQHFNLAKQILQAGKHLFIEKPPCTSAAELNQLSLIQQNKNLHALIGLQKRYAPVNTKLKTIANKATHYALKYQTGAYPEGNVLLDLFIHPLDLTTFLFGEAQIMSVQKTNQNPSSFTWFIHLKHNNGIIGNIQLSTDYSWTEANEQLIINTPAKIYTSEGTTSLKAISKPRLIAGIPLEKVKTFNPVTETLYAQNNFLPVKEHNQLYSSGYYTELKTFLQLCEGKNALNKSNFHNLTNTYQLIEKLQQ